MAIAKDIISQGLSGAIGKEIVFKRYADKTVVTKYPDMKKIVPSAAQKIQRKKFKEANAFAKSINNDPVKRAAYGLKIPSGKSVYRWAVKEYMKSELVMEVSLDI